jgi:hypothetical protein
MDSPAVTLTLKRFLLLERCPEAWKGLNLYLFRDERLAFYAGQSQSAYGRVWEHLLGGFHGHSTVGRFVWVNWPKSMHFTLELMSAHDEHFAQAGNELDAAERLLIERWRPCFNIAQNSQPAALPAEYLPANAPFRRRQGLNALRREAERAVRAEDTRAWLRELAPGE